MVRLALADRFAGRSAVVTGAGSGIGAALSRALVAAGADVVCADLDLDAAEKTVASATGPGTARAVLLDVTSAADVATLVADVAAEHGSLDLMFNNAGISIGGETQELTLDHWDSIIDVNIRGVVHGVHAAYPVMVAQRGGHIVNTASMGGLMAAGLLTSYVMTKHAVVGLSLALRSEAAAFGVGVTAVCPSAVDTAILDKGAVGRFHGRDYFLKGQGVRRPLDPEVLAAQVLEAVAHNKPLLVTPRTARIAWRIGRLSPSFVASSSIRFVAKQRKLQAKRGGPRLLMLTRLVTHRLRLEPVTNQHLPLLAGLNADPEVMRHILGRAATADETASEWRRRRDDQSDPSRGLGYWVGFADNAFVGWWSASSFTTEPTVAGLGYRLVRAAWGRGLATEGARRMLAQAFACPDISRVAASTMAINSNSRAVLTKAGLSHTRTWVGEWDDPIEGWELGEVKYQITRGGLARFGSALTEPSRSTELPVLLVGVVAGPDGGVGLPEFERPTAVGSARYAADGARMSPLGWC